jgi:hypothetical protein
MEILHEARRMALADYPGAEFHVLLWDEDNADNRAIRDGLRQRGITVHLMSDILPNYRADDLNEEYRIHARDAHPNARANKLIARYIVGEILNARGSELDVNAAAPALRSRWSPTSQRTRRGRGRRPSADPVRGHCPSQRRSLEEPGGCMRRRQARDRHGPANSGQSYSSGFGSRRLL